MMLPPKPLSQAWAAALLSGLVAFSAAADGDRDYEEQGRRPVHLQPPPSPALSPEEAIKTLEVAPGFRVELVVSEPLIEDPVAMEFDTRGRLWVVEMRGFMQDIEATGQFDPVGRVSVCLDEDQDGVMDRSIVFADKLVLPRSICILSDGVLIAEHGKLWFMRDRDGDLVADEKTVVDPEYATSGSVEHRPNGLLLAIDNWIYNAKSEKRYRREGDSWVIGKTELRGQWGICQDNYGRLFYNFNWSQLHADLAPPNTLSRNPFFESTLAPNAAISNDQRVYPIRMNTGVNRGYRPGVLDDSGKLLEFASACSPLIYRGDLFPDSFSGNAFVCAPGANTVKRNLVSIEGLRVTASNGYPDRDFIASTDERFRPVALGDGPDGALYLVDMYRGIIQQSEFMTSFLREESIERDLAKPIHLGRIYRILPENAKPDYQVHVPETTAELVGLLKHPSGWWRDRARERLIAEQAVEEVPALEAIARGEDAIPALHSLYVLEGLHHLQADLLRELTLHRDAALAGAAMRLLADHFPEEEIPLSAAGDEERAFHLAVALGIGKGDRETLFSIATRYAETPLIREAVLSSLSKQELDFLSDASASAEWEVSTPGKHALLQGVAATAARAGDGKILSSILEMPSAQAWHGEAILDGLLAGLQERENPPVLPRKPNQGEAVLAAFLNWPGHEAKTVERKVGRPLTKSERRRFAKGQPLYANLCASCHAPSGRGMTPLAPPLRNSEWVTGDPDRLIKILLHGLEGPVTVSRKNYEPPQILPAMPPVGMMADKDLAAILTYLRRAWGHSSDPISSGEVRKVRDLNLERRTAWTAEELLAPASAAR